ncbi:hypothetical protein Tco_0513569 [Tanacetum coccineum]
MTTTAALQVALDNALVPLEKRVEIGKCNMRIDPAKTQKEPTYQVVLDALALTTCHLAFLIIADIRPRLPTQEFDAFSSDEEIVSFIKELGHKGDIKSITEVFVDHMYQPWRTITAIINKCLSGKIIASPKVKRKVKRHASPSKKRTLVTVKEEEPELTKKVIPTKNPASKRQSSGVQIRDTPATTSTTVVLDLETLNALHQRIVDLEKDVKELKDVDNSSKVISTIKSEVPNAVKEYLGSNLDDALHKVIQRKFADIIKEHSVLAEIIERLRQQYAPQKSIKDIKEIKMEHARKQQAPKESITSSDTTALEEFDHNYFSIREDKDAIDEGFAKKLKKRKPDDIDKDEGPSAGSDRGLKRRKTSKGTEPSKKAKSTETSKGTSKSQTKSTGKSAQAEEIVFEILSGIKVNRLRISLPRKGLSDLSKAEKPLRTFDVLMSTPIDVSAFVMNHLQISELTQDILVGPAYNIIKGNMEECYKALTDQLDWNNPKDDRYPFDLSKPLPLVMLGNHQIVPVDYFFNNDLAYLQRGSTNRTYTTSLTKTKAAKYDLPRIEDMQLYKFMEGDFPRLHLYDINDMLILLVQNRLFNLKGDVIVHLATTLHKLGRNRLVCSHEIYKFSDGILIYLLDTLKDMANIGYTSVMPRRRWNNLDKKRSRIMIKDIDRQLLDRRLMRSLEKFVGG